MFVGSVVIAGNDAGAKIHVFADLAVSHIGQVIDFALILYQAVFHFNEIPDSYLVFKHSPGANSCKRSDPAISPDHGIIDQTVGLDHAVFANGRVPYDCIRPDHHTMAKLDPPFQYHVDINHAILAKITGSAQVKA